MSSLEFSDVVRRIVEQYVEDHVYTAIPAKVIGVDNFATDQTVDIQPQIVNTFKDNRNVELPPVLDVPIIFPSAGGGILSFPISIGDTVLAVFSQKSIDEWINSDADQTSYTPKDHRTYSLNDAIAISGLYTKNTNLNPNSTDVELKFKGSSIKLKANGDIEIIAANNLTATVTGNADITAPTINLNGNVNISGDLGVTGSTSLSSTVTSNGVDISDTHIHSGVTTGGGNSGPPV